MVDSRVISRNYGLDIARILAIWLVLVLHITNFGTGNWCETSILGRGVLSFSMCCVDLFALLSGYLGINSRWRLTKFLILWVQVAFTGFATLFIAHLLFGLNASFKDFISAFFPIVTSQYWYFTAYAAVFFLTPILNFGVRAMTRKQVMAFIVFGGVFLIGNTLLPDHDCFVLESGYSAFWLIIMYILGAILRIYISKRILVKVRPYIWFAGAFVFSALTWGQYWAVDRFPEVAAILRYQVTLCKYTSPTVVLCAICLLIGCASLEIKSCRVRNAAQFFAPAAFGVFLIHSQPVIRHKCWPSLMPYIGNFPMGLDVLALILFTGALFVVLALIERLRMLLFAKIGFAH